jgi:glutathionylspermidine synthase
LPQEPVATAEPRGNQEFIGVDVRDGAVLERDDGPYGKEGHVRQALAELPAFAGRHALVGSWIVGAEPAGLCMREGTRRITTDRARFVPHLILG